jgi:hypothetical protein
MSRFIRAIVVAGILAAVVGATRANAQMVEPLRFTTTFAFTAGGATFPAGTYTIRPMDIDPTVLEITNASGTQTKIFIVEPAGSKTNQKIDDEVVFKRQGDQYTLSQIWDGADQVGVEAMPPSATHHRHHHLG